VKVKKQTTTGVMALVKTRWFFTKSCYGAAGLGMRRIQSDLRFDDELLTDNRYEIRAVMSSTSPVAELAVGNIWMLDKNMYMGGEWISYEKNFGGTPKLTVDSADNVQTPTYKKIMEMGADEARQLNRMETVSMKFVFGVQF
ncbi:MAG: hypothetical protein HQK54_06160, partial [Oligoflexales bacterium]|nr:hypothetical protein [Oligoflexales bacterium]